MNEENFKNIINGRAAFYAWQCITIQLKDREFDLVIPLDSDMDALIEVLTHAMDTVNGIKNSAKYIY